MAHHRTLDVRGEPVTSVGTLPENQEEFLRKRVEFVNKYMEEHGYDTPEQVPFEEIMALRERPEWRDPLGTGEKGPDAFLVAGAVIVKPGEDA